MEMISLPFVNFCFLGDVCFFFFPFRLFPFWFFLIHLCRMVSCYFVSFSFAFLRCFVSYPFQLFQFPSGVDWVQTALLLLLFFSGVALLLLHDCCFLTWQDLRAFHDPFALVNLTLGLGCLLACLQNSFVSLTFSCFH